MELLYPDGSIATISKIPVIDRPWQCSDIIDSKRSKLQTPKEAAVASQKNHLQFFTTIKMKTSKSKKEKDASANEQQRQFQHTAPPKPWSRNTTARSTNYFLMSPYEFQDNSRRTPFYHLDDAIEKEQLNAHEQESMTNNREEFPTQSHNIDEIPLKSQTDKKAEDDNLKLEDVNYEPAKLALLANAKKPLPKIEVIPKPVTLVNVDAILDSKKQDEKMKTMFDSRLRRQIWCHGLEITAEQDKAKTGSLFSNITLPQPKNGHGLKPPAPQILFNKQNPPVLIIPETKPTVKEEAETGDVKRPESQTFGQISRTSPMLPQPIPVARVAVIQERMRIQPPIPEKIGPSVETIMKDMNKALNNLFYYPHQVQPRNSNKHLSQQKLSKEHKKQKHCSKHQRYRPDEKSISKLADKARREYDFTHLHKEDYAQPLYLPEIGITCGPHPKSLKNPHLMVCLGGFSPDTPELSESKVKKARAPVEKSYAGPSNFDTSKNEFYLVGSNSISAAHESANSVENRVK
ncbi:UNVERIFIED_CONTAM: hypothetical protein HDU68_005609 [Siphonaria sp. JEL0065]|nr:hypothetical protein HDU68_005609 [Siphonaria sp. JEL0065]